MEEEKSHEGISRRELVQGLALLGLFGAGGGALAGAVVAEGNGTDPDYENLRKVLVERLVNTRYYLAEDGSVVVLLNDEVWPGDEGGAYHQDWLFNPNDGLKENPHAALEDTVVTDIEHKGIPQGWNLGGIDTILSTSRQLGLLDDANLVTGGQPGQDRRVFDRGKHPSGEKARHRVHGSVVVRRDACEPGALFR